MKKRILSAMLVLVMVMTMLPAAMAAGVFTDVADSDWFAEEVEYVYDNGLMNGVGDDLFAPYENVSRAMLWTTLARMAGVSTKGSDPWYEAGQNWAVRNDVSDGTGAMDNVTREQLVTMLYRYADSPEVTARQYALLASYPDADKVSDWAEDAVAWALKVGILNGMDGKLNPQGSANRAQLAAILYRYVELVLDAEEKEEEKKPVVVIPSHTHSYGDWEPNNNGTHSRGCECDAVETEKCDYDEDGVCTKCGFVENAVAVIGDEYYTSAQAALDAAVDGDTIELFAGNHGDLVFRVNEDSELVDDAYYYMSNYDSSYYGQSNWQYAKRTINGLTITGVEGAIINSFTTSDARDDSGNAKGTCNNMFEITNLTISGITIANGISFNTSNVQVAVSETTTTLVPHVKIDGLTIDNCKTTTGGDTTSAGGRKLLGIANTGSASNAKNIVVTNCTVTDMYQGVYVVDGENVRIEGNSFSGLTHNSIHINKHCSGTITISGNTIDRVTDRPIRFSGVQSGTVTISNNTITNSEGDNGQYFKASAMNFDVVLTWENNTIDGVGIVLTTSGTDVIGIKATSKIGSVYYATAQEALDAAVDGNTIELFAGNHGDLVFRVNEDSELVDCYYFMSNYDSSFYGQEEWRFAKRTIDGLTIIGAEGAVIDSFTASLPRDDDGNAKGTRNNLFEIANLKFSNLTITNGIKLNTGDVTVAVEEGTVVVPRLKIDGLTIDNCKTPDTGDNSKDAWRVLVSIGNEGTNSNAKDIVVTNCVVKSTYQGVYIVDGVNVLVENNSFSNITHNSIHVNDHCAGTIVVTGNTMDNVQDRPIRFNGVQSGTVTISNNTITNSEGDNGQYFKASAMGSDVALTWENNTADGTAIVLSGSDDRVGTKAS